MVSRRNFFSIIMMMAALTFMFQFSQVIKENASNYDINEYAGEEPIPDAHRLQEGTSGGHGGFDEEDVVFLGNSEDALGRTVSQWCVYTRRELTVLNNMSSLNIGKTGLPGLVLIDSRHVNFATETEVLAGLVEAGVPLIFCNLPETAVLMENQALTGLLGISQIREEPAQVEGIHLFSGFLLGGEAIYKAQTPEEAEKQDMELNIPWYMTGKGTKTYMVGMLDEKKYEREEFPRIIWRNNCGNAMVFAVNGEYLSGLTGLGLLDAMVYEMETYEIYPVVNAQNMLLVDFPVLAPENTAGMEKVYSRSPEAAMRDVMWPGIAAMSLKNKLRLTCLVNAKYDYTDAAQSQGEELPFYLQQLRESSAEAGISFRYRDEAGFTLADKLKSDKEFYDSLDSDYKFSAAYFEVLPEQLGEVFEEGAGRLEDIRTVAYRDGGERPLLSWNGENVILQGITGDAGEYSYSIDLQMRSLATALGYSNTLIDMHNAMWPESEEDQWENYFDEIFSNVSTYWTKYGGFEQTVMSESDRRIRRFLNLDYAAEREGYKLTLNQQGGEDDTWFVLRLHGESVKDIQGGECKELESGAYLIHAMDSEVKIALEKSDDVLEYAGPFVK
ncbi:MAG: DUF2194 domain-containing protein [Acetatifactor sp.]|nr:DUF2194 domain-containing protein [Acetatifactor sp.]